MLGGRECTRLSTEDGESEVVILEVQSNARKVDDGFDACLLQLLGVTDAATLQDQGEESVPPEITIIFLARKVRDCCCLGGLVSIRLIR